jgi:hypothetical protein
MKLFILYYIYEIELMKYIPIYTFLMNKNN